MVSHVRENESTKNRNLLININRVIAAVSRHWFFLFMLVSLTWVLLPWLAPVFMRLGWLGPASAIYWLYSFQCHQLPQRSFFLFGSQSMYPLEQISKLDSNFANPLILRQFIGNVEMGYKVAWSDRMVSAYTSIPLAALIWWPFRKKLGPIPLWAFILLAVPMAIDGGTHMISDIAGLGQGFRYTNAWLAELTHYSLPNTFYAGNALGSFNSWMRLITGVLFGVGFVLFALPYLYDSFGEMKSTIEEKFKRADMEL